MLKKWEDVNQKESLQQEKRRLCLWTFNLIVLFVIMKSPVKLKCKIFHKKNILRLCLELTVFSLKYFRDKSRNSAMITCRVCMEDYQTSINFLSEPIDVYNDWIDECEREN